MDRELAELRRRSEAEPGDRALRDRYLFAAVRAHGDQARTALKSMWAWNPAPQIVQDAGVGLVAAAMEERFDLLGIRTFEEERGDCSKCSGLGRVEERSGGGAFLHYEEDPDYSIRDCPECDGSGGGRVQLQGRTAIFLHRSTGIELSMIPSGDRCALLSRTVVTRGQYLGDSGPDADLPALIGSPGISEDEVRAWLTSQGLRLPGYSEWTSGLSGAKYMSLPDTTDFEKTCTCPHPHPVTRFAEHPSSYGVIEILGNVWEMSGGGSTYGGACGDPTTSTYDFERRVPRELVGFRAACDVLGWSPPDGRPPWVDPDDPRWSS